MLQPTGGEKVLRQECADIEVSVAAYGKADVAEMTLQMALQMMQRGNMPYFIVMMMLRKVITM
ncbi:MAG: hypothetical protein IJU77_01610 [Butyrivibrio sp.]|nr:hypothetical protein [Butyrivibrio sp.]